MKMVKFAVPFLSIVILMGCKKNNSQQNVVNTISNVVICDQIWMSENLDIDHYSNGDIIPEVTDTTLWKNLTTGAWCYQNNDAANNATYGKLYNWYAVHDPRGLAPIGWHIPSDSEWARLIDTCLGGSDIAGGAMKKTDSIHWHGPNTSATNSSGFSGLPGGYRLFLNGAFRNIGLNGGWWSTTVSNSTNAWYCILAYGNPNAFMLANDKRNGFSVRCVKN